MSTVHTHSTPHNVIAVLRLPATSQLPRELSLTLGLLTGHLTVLTVADHHVIVAADADGTTAEVAESAALGHVLRVGNARFKLHSGEVEQVRSFFLKSKSPCAETTIGPDSAKQAAPVVLPPDGSCRESPPPDASRSGGGALGKHQSTEVNS